MADFHQNGVITTLHDLGENGSGDVERLLREHCAVNPIALILPVTADDMRAPAFRTICATLAEVDYLAEIVVTLGRTEGAADYRETVRSIAPLGGKARVLWVDGPRVQGLYREMEDAGLFLGSAGKGQAVWTAYGYLFANHELSAFALHDCDIKTYSRELLARLCLPMVHPGLNFEFCKAYYARYTDRLHGRAVRLLVQPLLQALTLTVGHNDYLEYMRGFRYPLAGEFAVTANLARYNRIPSDWGLELGTLGEVFRNTSPKRVCQVDLCPRYDHKHQELSAGDRNAGLMRMATDLCTTLLRTLASMGVSFSTHRLQTLRAAYRRQAQDAIRTYHADAVMNGLAFDRHAEELAVELFAEQVTEAGKAFAADPSGGRAIPNWNRVLSVLPDYPDKLRAAARDDAAEFA